MKQTFFLVALMASNLTYADTANLKSLNTYECILDDGNNAMSSGVPVYAKSADIAVSIFRERWERNQNLSSRDDIICTQKN